jgi:hypothetical protein
MLIGVTSEALTHEKADRIYVIRGWQCVKLQITRLPVRAFTRVLKSNIWGKKLEAELWYFFKSLLKLRVHKLCK